MTRRSGEPGGDEQTQFFRVDSEGRVGQQLEFPGSRGAEDEDTVFVDTTAEAQAHAAQYRERDAQQAAQATQAAEQAAEGREVTVEGGLRAMDQTAATIKGLVQQWSVFRSRAISEGMRAQSGTSEKKGWLAKMVDAIKPYREETPSALAELEKGKAAIEQSIAEHLRYAVDMVDYLSQQHMLPQEREQMRTALDAINEDLQDQELWGAVEVRSGITTAVIAERLVG